MTPNGRRLNQSKYHSMRTHYSPGSHNLQPAICKLSSNLVPLIAHYGRTQWWQHTLRTRITGPSLSEVQPSCWSYGQGPFGSIRKVLLENPSLIKASALMLSTMVTVTSFPGWYVHMYTLCPTAETFRVLSLDVVWINRASGASKCFQWSVFCTNWS